MKIVPFGLLSDELELPEELPRDGDEELPLELDDGREELAAEGADELLEGDPLEGDDGREIDDELEEELLEGELSEPALDNEDEGGALDEGEEDALALDDGGDEPEGEPLEPGLPLEPGSPLDAASPLELG